MSGRRFQTATSHTGCICLSSASRVVGLPAVGVGRRAGTADRLSAAIRNTDEQVEVVAAYRSGRDRDSTIFTPGRSRGIERLSAAQRFSGVARPVQLDFVFGDPSVSRVRASHGPRCDEEADCDTGADEWASDVRRGRIARHLPGYHRAAGNLEDRRSHAPVTGRVSRVLAPVPVGRSRGRGGVLPSRSEGRRSRSGHQLATSLSPPPSATISHDVAACPAHATRLHADDHARIGFARGRPRRNGARL